jgi:hypothetical protein
VVAQGEELGQYRYSVHYKQLALNLTTSKKIVVLGLTILRPSEPLRLRGIWPPSG